MTKNPNLIIAGPEQKWTALKWFLGTKETKPKSLDLKSAKPESDLRKEIMNSVTFFVLTKYETKLDKKYTKVIIR